jgi:capsule polysaccharide modification protein KpsS
MKAVIAMVNACLLLGSGFFADDVLSKLPWVRHLDKNHDLFVASRIKPEVHLGEHMRRVVGDRLHADVRRSMDELLSISKAYEVIYDSPFLNKAYSPAEIEAVEQSLGISFRYLASFDQSFYSRERMSDVRDDGLVSYCAGMAAFFREFFTRHKIDILFITLEDDTFSSVAYYAAKRLGIRIIGPVSGRFPKKGLMICERFTDVCQWDDREIDWGEIASMYSETTIVGLDNLQKNASYYSLGALRDRFQGIRFGKNYKRYLRHVLSNYPQEKYIIDTTGFRLEFGKFLLKLYRRKMIRRLLKPPAPGDKYFLFPLHFMDDAQVTFREPLLDQLKLIENIARALPEGYYLYVKPHPHYLGEDISHGGLKRLSRLANVKIVEPGTPPIGLMKGSAGLITINSTTGFEAIINGVPVITLGHDFYCTDGLCYVNRDLNDLPETLLDVINGRDRPDYGRAKKFVKAVYANTVWYDGTTYDFGYFGISDEEGERLGSAMNMVMADYRTIKA